MFRRRGSSRIQQTRPQVRRLGVITLVLLAAVLLGAPELSAQAGSTAQASFRLTGLTGEETVTVTADGDELVKLDLTTHWHILYVSVPTTTSDVRLNFVNDGLNADGSDRNVIVDWFEIDGNDGTTRIETESDEVLSRGVWNGTDCGEGYRNDEFLACTGWFEYHVDDLIDPPTDPPPNPIPVEFEVTGTTGTELMNVEINGQLVGRDLNFEGSNNGTFTVLWFEEDVPIETVRVLFTNDGTDPVGGDRNLFLHWIKVDEQTYDPLELESLGSWNGTDCGQGFRNSNWLHCNGWFEVVHGDAPPPPPPPGLNRVGVVAGGSTGEEMIGLEVNGEVVAVSTLSTELDEHIFEVPDVPLESLRVAFVNDAITDAGDRNVYVQLISYDGQELDPLDLRSKGSYNGVDCGEGFRNSNWLHCNGWFEIPLDSEPPPPPPPDSIVISFSGYGTTGTEIMSLEVNGETLPNWTLSKQWNTYEATFPADWDINSARLLFVNDGIDPVEGDRNVYVEWISFDGVRIDVTELESKGSWNGVDCGQGFRESNWLHCNGWFDLGLSGDLVAPTDFACVELPARYPVGQVRTTWTWANNSSADSLVEVVTRRNGVEHTEVLSYPGTSYRIESGEPYVELVEVASVRGDERAAAVPGDIGCQGWFYPQDPIWVRPAGPNTEIEVLFPNAVNAKPTDYYIVHLTGETFSERIEVPWADERWLSVVVESLPPNEVVTVDVRVCYDSFHSGCADGDGVRYHQLDGVMIPANNVDNPSLGAPTNMALSTPGSSWNLTWEPPATGSFDRYEIRSIERFNNQAYWQHASRTRSTPEGDTDIVDTAITVAQANLRLRGIENFPDSRYEVRACNTEGCGPWSNSTDWIDMFGNISPYVPDAVVVAPTDLSCAQLPALDPDVPYYVTEWTWTNQSSSNVEYEIVMIDGGVERRFAMPPGSTSFVYEVSNSDVSLTEIAVSREGERRAASTDGIECSEANHRSAYESISFDNPGSFTLEIPANVGSRSVSWYTVDLVGDSFVMTEEVPYRAEFPNESAFVSFTNVPVDEVVSVIVSTCYDSPISKCTSDGTMTHYHFVEGLYVDAGLDPSNPSLGAPQNLTIEGTLPTALRWDELPDDGVGSPPQYQVRRFEEDGPLDYQWAIGSRHPEAGLDLMSPSITIPNSEYRTFGDRRWRYEVRGCDAEGCGPWSDSSDWIDNNGDVTPYEP